MEAVKGAHADPDTVLREIFAAEPKRVLESMHKEIGGGLRYVIKLKNIATALFPLSRSDAS